MSDVLTIYFDNLDIDNVCFPGQEIKGRVECKLNEPKQTKGIQLAFEGKCITGWGQSESIYDKYKKDTTKRNIQYKGEEIYFKSESFLTGGHHEYTIQAGTYNYPFNYTLPHILPSSMEDDYGGISYTVTASMHTTWRILEKTIKKLKIISPFDLNTEPSLREAVEVTTDKTMFTWWFNQSSGALTFKMSLPVSGYVGGQEVPVHAFVENMTNVNAEKVNFSICKKVDFTVHHPTTVTKIKDYHLADCTEDGIGAHGERTWVSVLELPKDVNYPNLVRCSLIKASYYLKGEVVVPFPHINLRQSIPIMVGTIPLTNYTVGAQSTPTSSPDSNPDIDFDDPETNEPRPNDEPPSYEQVEKTDARKNRENHVQRKDKT